MKPNNIKQVNSDIRKGVGQFADIMLMAEADEWAYLLDYFPADLMNATYIFQHVASNIGIKAGKIDEAKAEEFGERLRQLIIDMTGYDPHQIAEQMKSVHIDLINPSKPIEA